MNRRLIVRPEAEADITDGAVWYESRERGLGMELISEVRSAISRALKNPESFTRVRRSPTVRRVLTRGFPYRVFFIAPLDALDEVDKVYMKNGVTFPPNPNALLTQTCLQLAENYQTNKDAETSSLFWRLANESKRLAECRGYKVWSLHWWYWILSFYGESWRRAALLLVLLIAFFSLAYASSFAHFVNSNKGTVSDRTVDVLEQQIMNVAKEADEYKLLNQPEALFYAVRVGTLQRPEPQPYNNFAKGLVTLETILVPLQTALFALAVRRRFMR